MSCPVMPWHQRENRYDSRRYDTVVLFYIIPFSCYQNNIRQRNKANVHVRPQRLQLLSFSNLSPVFETSKGSRMSSQSNSDYLQRQLPYHTSTRRPVVYIVHFSVISQAQPLTCPPLKPIKDIITGTGSRYTKIHGVLGNACQDQRAPSKQEAIACT